MSASKNKVAGRQGISTQGGLLILFVLALGVTFFLTAKWAKEDKEYIGIAGEQPARLPEVQSGERLRLLNRQKPAL